MEAVPMVWKAGSVGAGVMDLGRPKVDAGNAGLRDWSVTLVAEVASIELAGQLDLFRGDVAAHWREAAEEVAAYRGRVKLLKDNHLSVVLRDEAGTLVRARAEVIEVVADFNTNRKVQTTKLVLLGVPASSSNDLVSMQGGMVEIEVGGKLELVRDVAPAVGQVLSGVTSTGAVVIGRMTGIDPETEAVVLDDFGTRYEVREVSTAHTLESTDAVPVEDHLARYMGAVSDPSWQTFVTAIGTVVARSGVQGMSGTTAYINAAVVDEAIGVPAEAGSPRRRVRG